MKPPTSTPPFTLSVTCMDSRDDASVGEGGSGNLAGRRNATRRFRRTAGQMLGRSAR